MAQNEQRPRAAADPMDRLKSEAAGLLGALGDRAITALRDRIEDTAGRLTEYSDGGGAGLMAAITGAKGLAEGQSPLRAMTGAGMTGLKEKVTGMFGKGGKDGGKGSRGKGLKVTNIVEQIDVGAPVGLTYNLWTQFADFPSFMKKVESVEQAEDEQLNWRAQILWSHRTWESTVLEQTPDEKIIWRSKGAKGYVDGAVTFHELAPRLTRIIFVLEYHPQGFFEHTGNLWRAQGRRVRLELKHFRRHLMSEVLLHPDEVEGWRGVIRDGQVADEENGEADSDRNDDAARQDDRRAAGSARVCQAGSGVDGDEPDRGEREARTRHADGPGRMERSRRRPQASSGPTNRGRRPTGESRRAVPRQRPGSGERAGSEHAGGERAGSERAGGERAGGERSGQSAQARRSAGP